MPKDTLFQPPPIRGVHIDCRAQMLRCERIVEILHDLVRWGYNTILLEYENRFHYTGRMRPICAEDALTRQQVREIARTASDLGLSVMPLVQCLGHLEYVLCRRPFRRLAEPCMAGGMPHTACPSHPGSRSLFRDMAEQVLELHPDCRYLHMGGDEALLNPDCRRCGPRLRDEGACRILAEHFVDRADWLRRQGPDPIIWGDLPLAHPEVIPSLRGHLIVMDWDYWSGTRPARWAPIWGSQSADPLDPRTWPKKNRELFVRHILTEDGKRTRPFPYAPFLAEQGLQVITASAARSSGDNFCVPMARHVDNAIGAARTAGENHLLGNVVTSWAVRRGPWPLTEYALIAAGMTLHNPRVRRRQIDAAFAREHFGVDDPALARVHALLANKLSGLIESRPRFDPRTAGWPSDWGQRMEPVRRSPAGCRRELRRLREAVPKALALLARTRPGTPRQRERVAFWRWAAAVLAHFADFGDQVLLEPGAHDVARLKKLRKRASTLSAKTDALLVPWYTARTLREERQTRFGVQLAYIDEMATAATRARGTGRKG